MMDIQTLRRLAITETHPALRRQYQAELAALPDVVEKVQEVVGLPPDIQNLKYRVATEPNPTMRAEYALKLGDALRAHSRTTRVRKAAEWTNSELTVIAARSLVTAAQKIQAQLEAVDDSLSQKDVETVGNTVDFLAEQVANAEKYLETIHEGLDALAAMLDEAGGEVQAAASASLRKEAAPPELTDDNGGAQLYRAAVSEGMNMQNVLALYNALKGLHVYASDSDSDAVARFALAVQIEDGKDNPQAIPDASTRDLYEQALTAAGLDGGEVQAAAGVEDQPRPQSTEAMGLAARAPTRKANKTLRPHLNKSLRHVKA
jgi:hypothetical protein